MPERPDLDYIAPILDRELAGAEIADVELHKAPILRLALETSLQDALVGRRILGVERHLHFLRFRLETPGPGAEVDLIVAPMLAGSFAVHPDKKAGSKRGKALSIALSDGRDLRYRDDVQMGKAYVIPRGKTELIPGYAPVGLDVLDPEVFTWEAFRSLARKRRDQSKVFLLDKSALDSFGNAYADEVLFAAGIHPKTFVRALDEASLLRLFHAIPSVLRSASEEIHRRQPPTDDKVRDFLKVRNRHKQPCSICSTPIRKAGVRGHDAFFCPRCQPETRKSGIVTWSPKQE